MFIFKFFQRLFFVGCMTAPFMACALTPPIPQINGKDLPYALEMPASSPKGVVVLVHGSGPQSMDVNLTNLTLPKGTQNLFFKDLAESLRREGFATLRYDKRSYAISKVIASDVGYKGSSEFKKFMADPMTFFYDDFIAFTKYARTQVQAKVYALGHSQGTNLVTYGLKEKGLLDGAVLIGFYNEPLTTLSFEQVVYRSVSYFNSIDSNKDAIIDSIEIENSQQLKKQMPTIDLDKDNRLSLAEFKSANYLNYLLTEQFHNSSIRKFEVKMGRPSKVLQKINKQVLFLQGEWDNQTPAYVVRSLETANRLVWKKENLKFKFFKKRGHALDLRSNYGDLNYRKNSTKMYDLISEQVSEFFNK